MTKQTEYKGNPVIQLKASETDKFPFSFGVRKARLIVENIGQIKKFVAAHTETVEEKSK